MWGGIPVTRTAPQSGRFLLVTNVQENVLKSFCTVWAMSESAGKTLFWVSSGGCWMWVRRHLQLLEAIALPCHIAFSNMAGYFVKLVQSLWWVYLNRQSLIYRIIIIGVTFHHLYYVLLVRNKSQVLPTLKGTRITQKYEHLEEKTIWGPP